MFKQSTRLGVRFMVMLITLLIGMENAHFILNFDIEW